MKNIPSLDSERVKISISSDSGERYDHYCKHLMIDYQEVFKMYWTINNDFNNCSQSSEKGTRC